MAANINGKVQAGNFWGKDGAIADTRRLALFALNQPGSSLIDGISPMIDIHTKALGYTLTEAREFTKGSMPHGHYWNLYRKSKRALWLYNTLWQVLSFFSWL
jgi:hypothetical protein